MQKDATMKDASSTGDKVERDALPVIDAFTEELVQLCRKYQCQMVPSEDLSARQQQDAPARLVIEVFTVERDDGESANFTGITQHGAMKWPLRSKEEGRK
jgi:hypothetical protein